MTDFIKILVDFAEGRLSDKDFEQELYSNKELEVLLSDEKINWYGTYLHGSSPFLFLAEQNYKTAEGIINAQGAVKMFLEKLDIEVSSTDKYSEEYDLLHTAVPKYLDLDSEFFEKFIMPADRSLSKAEKKQIIKKNIDQLFNYQTKPPKWIQNPNWLIRDDRPMYFLGQLEIKNCVKFHDDGCVYLFMDTETGNIETVKQYY